MNFRPLLKPIASFLLLMIGFYLVYLSGIATGSRRTTQAHGTPPVSSESRANGKIHQTHTSGQPVNNPSNRISELESFLINVNQSTTWELPLGNRIDGVHSVRLVDSPETWIEQISPEFRPLVRAYIARYPDAYQFSSKAEMAWLLSAGFPALEEVVAFQSLPENERNCRDICRNGKYASLSADVAIFELNERIEKLNLKTIQDLKSHPLYGDQDKALIQAERGRALHGMSSANDQGSQLFAFRQQMEFATMDSNSQEEISSSRSILKMLASHCGDTRFLFDKFGNPKKEEIDLSSQAKKTLEYIEGYRLKQMCQQSALSLPVFSSVSAKSNM